VTVRNNRIWNNGGLGIDIGLDGPTPVTTVRAPVLTLAHYDAAANQTVIEGDLLSVSINYDGLEVDFYAGGDDEGERPLGVIRLQAIVPQHFRFTVAGDLTGQRVTATATRVLRDLSGLETRAQGVDFGWQTQTSEFSRAIEVR
jgi:hypothetical protein